MTKSQSLVEVMVDMKPVRRFELQTLYDLNVQSLFFCGWKFNNVRVWSKATEVGDLGLCGNRHRSMQFAQNNLERYSQLQIQLDLEDAYDYTYGLPAKIGTDDTHISKSMYATSGYLNEDKFDII